MAITNAQQYQQILNNTANGKRPGYRGDAAYRSRSAQSSPSAGGQGNVGTQASFGGSDRDSSQSTVYGPTRPSDKPPSSKRVKESREEFETAVGLNQLESLYRTGVPKSNLPGFFGAGLNAISPFRNFTLRKNIDYFECLKSRNRLQNYPQTLEGYTQYMKDRSAGAIDAAGNPVSRDRKSVV